MGGTAQNRPPTRQTAATKICKVCGDEIEIEIGHKVEDGDQLFVACHVCAFPVCRPCYEYERSEGTQCCPQCNTRYKRHKGSPRIAGDEDDNSDHEDFEDHEFQNKNPTIKDDHTDRHVRLINSQLNLSINLLKNIFIYHGQFCMQENENGDYNNQQWQHPNGQAFSVAESSE